MQPILRQYDDTSWVFAIILAIGLAFILMKFMFPKTFANLGNPTAFKESDDNVIPFAIFVYIIIGCLISVVMIPYLHIPNLITQKSWTTVAFITSISVVFIMTKFLINTIIANYTNDTKEFSWLLKSKVYNRVYWIIVLLICILLLYYSDVSREYILYTVLGSFAVILTLEYYYALTQSNLRHHIFSYYFILYLCIFEIFPVLYIYNHWYGS